MNPTTICPDVLEAPMRMFANAASAALLGLEIPQAGIVEQQERADRCRIFMVAEQRPNGKAVTHPVAPMVAQNAVAFFYRSASRKIVLSAEDGSLSVAGIHVGPGSDHSAEGVPARP